MYQSSLSDWEKLEHETAGWKEEQNRRWATVNWQFTAEKARDKFDTAYGNIKKLADH